LNILMRNMIVFLEYVILGPVLSQEPHDELNGNTRAFEDWLAPQHIRIDGDSIVDGIWIIRVNPAVIEGRILRRDD